MTTGPLPPAFDRRAAPRPPRWARYVIACAVASVIFAEAVIDFRAQPAIAAVAAATEVVLYVGYAAWLGFLLWRGRRDLRAVLYGRRLLLLMMALSFPLVFIAPRACAIGVIARLVVVGARDLTGGALGKRVRAWPRLRPSQTLALSFLGLIAVGAVLLLFPAATSDGRGTSLTDAVFTMASATSVTGLIVQDTGTYFSTFGLMVIVGVMQTGAIGIMVLAAAFAVLVGGRLPGRDKRGLEEAGFGDVMDVGTIEGLKRLVISITITALVIELIGAAVLFLFWATGVMPLREQYDSVGGALWWCVFHSISAFCHAGFSLEPNSIEAWVNNPLVTGTFMVLITLGGFGFPVLADLAIRGHYKNRSARRIWRSFHIQTRVVLFGTLLLNVAGMLLWLYFEYDASLASLAPGQKVSAALFQSVTLRSAGFNTVPLAGITAPTVVFSLVYMFIGSAPGSTGGGVRVTTAAVVMLSVRAMLRGRDDVEVYGRSLPKSIVYRSISIVLIAGILCATFLVLVTATQTHLPFNKLLFETISAFGTVGLSMGVTGDLDTTGKWLLSVLMYFGRVGPMTLALAVGERVVSAKLRYPEGRIAVG